MFGGTGSHATFFIPLKEYSRGWTNFELTLFTKVLRILSVLTHLKVFNTLFTSSSSSISIIEVRAAGTFIIFFGKA